ncbi:hypothetical protein [Actinomadura welshii]|uniref:hypothetical protein n=1 Tax=Actinomadura welshii TaxID=3103817 RepID=UPI0003ACF862|nr:hypothetical protein [Actinomadura madurae]
MDEPIDRARLQAGLRLIARGLEEIAGALDGPDEPGELERMARVMREWGPGGLRKDEASALFKRHGFAPQTTGGWTRGDWVEIGGDGLRYLTAKSREWLAGYEEEEENP